MNTAEFQQVNVLEAARLIFRAMMVDPSLDVIITKDGYRVYTRESENPEKNANGGDYDFWTWVGVSPDGLQIIENWSADWDYADWGGSAWICRAIKSPKTLAALMDLVGCWANIKITGMARQDIPSWHPINS